MFFYPPRSLYLRNGFAVEGFAQSILSAILLLVALGFVMPSGQAKDGDPLFFETTVVQDTPGDYQENQALDLLAVHLAEKYAYDVDEKTGQDILTTRFEVASVRDVVCETEIRFELFFRGASNATRVYAGLTTYPPLGGSYRCQPRGVAGSGPVFVDAKGRGVTVQVPVSILGIVPGTALSGLYAQSSLRVGDEFVVQDVAPWDNGNLPYAGNPPVAGLPSYVANGTFPFFSVEPLDALEQTSVGGEEVKYEFHLVSHPALIDDLIRIMFHHPEGWSVSPSLGEPGPPPVGVLSGGGGGEPRAFAFRLRADGPANEGEAALVVMEAISDSGGHVRVATTTTVSGPKIVDPMLSFSLLTPGPFTAGETSLLRFGLVDLGRGVFDPRVVVDVLKDGAPIASVAAEPSGEGVFEAAITFPTEGRYMIDVYLAHLRPSPHQEFEVSVESSGGRVPGPGAWALLIVLSLTLWLAGRRN